MYRTLNLAMFTNPRSPGEAFPRLKGKAAEIRSLGPALLATWGHYMDQGNLQHRQVRTALRCSCTMDEVLDRNPAHAPALDAGDGAIFADAAWGYLQLFSALSVHYVQTGRKLFNVTIKAHFLGHLALRAAAGANPRTAWCFMGEDYMAKVRRLAQASCRGVSEARLSEKMLTKYRWAIHLAFLPGEGVWR
jgi:hypothetical protein